ncbi:hypothetical protein Acr_26g0003530 [Actinidia rufa]|uniref:RNase H type-1 domain-containing protein n=1 Tax=Actinidia rufa TaxID=165716 RepID=A0A7J0H1V5_9ERIC|nr:hypothetical protein Acr_26g0003530 [Actinidia rufa]
MGAELILYLSISPTAVSAILIQEEDKIQKPVYYVSKVLMKAKTRMAIKAQALPDFIAEFTHDVAPDLEMALLEVETPEKQSQEVDLTSNEAKYEALLVGLRVAAELGVESLDTFSNSYLVVNQVQGDYLAKDLRMVAYLDKVKAISSKIRDFKISQIPWKKNKKADALANLASALDFISDRNIPLEFLPNPSIDITNPFYQDTTNLSWMDDIITYLKDGKLPLDKL